jgi:hypothetical protein
MGRQAPEERWLETVHAAVQEANRLLMDPRPEALDRSAALLEQARRGLEVAADSFNLPNPPARAGIRAELEELRHGLRRQGLLLEHAAGFYGGWVRFRNSLTGGYTAQGEPAPVEPGGRLLIVA